MHDSDLGPSARSLLLPDTGRPSGPGYFFTALAQNSAEHLLFTSSVKNVKHLRSISENTRLKSLAPTTEMPSDPSRSDCQFNALRMGRSTWPELQIDKYASTPGPDKQTLYVHMRVYLDHHSSHLEEDLDADVMAEQTPLCLQAARRQHT
jgi:hypothetical protein